MKRLFLFLLVLAFILKSTDTYAKPKVCPDSQSIEEVSIERIREVENALQVLVPIAYEIGEFPEHYSEWELISLTPLQKTVENDEEKGYYELAINYCGKEVADHSWLVRLHFPKVQVPNAKEGQIFIAKKKESGWVVWFKSH